MQISKLGIMSALLCATSVLNAATLTPLEINTGRARLDASIAGAMNGESTLFSRGYTFFKDDTPMVVSAKDVLKVFQENQLKGKLKYGEKKNGNIIVTGKVEEVDLEMDGTPRVVAMIRPASMDGVVFKFAELDDVIEELSELKRGQEFRFVCKCKGKEFLNVEFTDCFTKTSLTKVWNRMYDKYIKTCKPGKKLPAPAFNMRSEVRFGIAWSALFPPEGKEACSKGPEACYEWYEKFFNSKEGDAWIAETSKQDKTEINNRLKEFGLAPFK